MQHGWRLTSLVLLAMTAGCIRGPNTTAVRGEVTFDGRVVKNGRIDFLPIEGTPGASAGAAIADGWYEVSDKSGLHIDGRYQVRIIGLRKTGKTGLNRIDPGGSPVELQENFIPAIYNTQSTLKVHVADVPDRNELDFALAAR